MERDRGALAMGAQLAEDLHLALLARGFFVRMQAAPPLHGRAYVSVEPLRHEVARRLIDVLGPPAPERRDGDPWTSAEDALTELRRALFAARLTLPSLGLDGPCMDREKVLVTLGNARPDVVHRLADVVLKGAQVTEADARSRGETC
ncbi:hypothetical protein [Streptomyces sp. NPDC048248]|uniref:hypothetical protein n=1 Tax=Streptomyces sp. NPDC048248 TaxID=3365523 RepID=UPI00370FEA1E